MGYVKLHKQSFFHNLDYFTNLANKDKIAISLKDNAYGHGIEEVSSMAQEYGIKHVFVKSLDEANRVKKYGFKTILVLYDIPDIKDDNLIISINSIEQINKIPNNSKVELKIDTGMNRNGVDISSIKDAIDIINEKKLKLNGVFTHFCCADEDNNITALQEEKFQEAIQIVKQYIKYNFRVHCANSAGIHKVDMDKYDLARIGIGVYGYLDLEEERYLKPVLSLYAKKIATKRIKKGDHVGYGSDSFIALQDMVVSNYDIGYGDGFIRANTKKQRKIANGLEILGKISMDSFSIQSSAEEVCVFDNVNELAKTHNTINYEILTNIKPTIKRVIV